MIAGITKQCSGLANKPVDFGKPFPRAADRDRYVPHYHLSVCSSFCVSSFGEEIRLTPGWRILPAVLRLTLMNARSIMSGLVSHLSDSRFSGRMKATPTFRMGSWSTEPEAWLSDTAPRLGLFWNTESFAMILSTWGFDRFSGQRSPRDSDSNCPTCPPKA